MTRELKSSSRKIKPSTYRWFPAVGVNQKRRSMYAGKISVWIVSAVSDSVAKIYLCFPIAFSISMGN